MQEVKESLFKGLVGILGSIGLPTATKLADVQQWLQITSLVVGIIVGVLSGLSLLRSLIKNNKK